MDDLIKNISIEDFRGVVRKDFVPRKLNVLAGPNGYGKTSILDAVKFALTGKGEASDVRKGASKAVVTLDLGNDVIIRSRGIKGVTAKVNKKPASNKAVSDLLDKAYGISTDILPAMDADFFASLSKADFSKLMAHVLPVTMSFDGFQKAAEAVNGNTPLSPAQEAVCREVLPDGEFGMDDIEKAYGILFSERTSQRRVVAGLRPHAEWNQPTPDFTREDLDKQAASLNQMFGQLAAYAQAKQAYDRSQAAIAGAKAQIQALDSQLASMPEVRIPDQKALERAQMEKEKFLVARAQREGADRQGEKSLAGIQASVSFLEKTLAGLSGSRCPLSDRLVCGTDKRGLQAELSSQIGGLQNQIQDQQDALAENRAMMARYDEQIAKRDAVIAEYMKNVSAYNARAQLVSRRQAIQVPAPLQEPVPVPHSQEELSAMQAELNSRYSLLGAYERYKENRALLQQEVLKLDSIESLVPLFDARTGVRAYILGKALANLQDYANRKAEDFKPGFAIRFVEDDGILAYVTPGTDKAEVVFEDLSSGEQLFAAYLLMTCLASVKGMGIFFIDGFEKLDEENQAAFAELLRNDQDLSHVFIGIAGSVPAFAKPDEVISL